jgi:hypothetical protein
MPNPFFAPQAAITIGYYYKPPLYYARTVAIPGGSAMLINKRRFSRAL